MAVHFSSQTSEWPTPQWLFDALDKEFGFTLDPCSTHTNAKCAKHFTVAEDGLQQSWGDEVVFMNPPYGNEITQWMAKAHEAASKEGATVVCLVPARTDTAWWHRYAMKHDTRLLRRRLKFGDGKNSAPFPSAVVVMRPANFALRSWTIKPDAKISPISQMTNDPGHLHDRSPRSSPLVKISKRGIIQSAPGECRQRFAQGDYAQMRIMRSSSHRGCFERVKPRPWRAEGSS